MPSEMTFELGQALLTVYDENNFLDIQVDAPDGDNSGLHPYESHLPYGLFARPPDPEKDANGTPLPATCTNVLIAHEGGRGHVIPLENPAIVQKLPQIQPGENGVHGPVGQFVRFHNDGAISLWIPGKAGGPDASYRFTAEGIEFSGAMGTMRFTPEQFAVDHRSGASLRATAVGGLPAPLNQIASAITLQAGTVDLTASAVSLGPDTKAGAVPHQPLANATTLLVYLAELAAAINAIATALTTGGNSGGPVVFAGLPLVTTAVAPIAAPPLIMTSALASG
jgi:hypothetical protein